MINFKGQELQRSYQQSGKIDTDAIRQQKADLEALRAMRKNQTWKTKQREERMNLRIERLENMKPEVQLEKFEQNPTKGIDVEKIKSELLATTNATARKYGLPEPNNPEALAHDRTHCMCCDRKLHQPNAHKNLDIDPDLIDDEEVRLMCCWCFGKMDDDDIRSTMYTGMEADAKIRLKVYNPEQSTQQEIDSLIESKRIQLKSKLKRWEQDVALVGNVKHDYLLEVDQLENTVIYNAKTRYTACTL